MTREDLAFMSTCEQARLLRERKISPVELVEIYLERIHRFNDRLHAFITVCEDEALRQAKTAEAELSSGKVRGPLHGIPVGLKDQIFTKGVRTTGGSRIQPDFVPDEDATIVTRLKDAGAIIIGKQNLDELALGGTIEFPYGRPCNPWNLEYSATGSSGGSGVATAAALCSASIGQDAGGSIRRPASFNGCVGLRPTQGRVSRYGKYQAGSITGTLGPMTRTVEDCALLTEVIAGEDPRDAVTTSVPVPPYCKLLQGGVQGMRFGVLREFMDEESVDSEVRGTVLAALSVLEGQGAELRELSIPHVRLASKIGLAGNEGPSPLLLRWVRTKPELLDYGARVRIITNSVIPTPVKQMAQRAKAYVRREVLEAIRDVDAVLYPTHPVPPAPAGREGHRFTSVADVRDRMFGRRNHTLLAPLVGAPAISIPCGFTEKGLPIGLEILAWPFREDLLFRVAYAYQQVTDWHKRRPPI